MDCRANSDVFFLPDEKFDFDVSLSPASPDLSSGDEDEGGERAVEEAKEMMKISRGDEDEVFVGPISHKEKCVSANVGSPLEDHGMTWSPLTGEQLEAVCQEAHRLANQLQSTVPHSKDTDTPSVTMDTMTEGEEFFQDADTKLGLLTQTSSVLSPIKRQTFCVQDSPFKQLPPIIQHHLQRGSGSNATAASSTRPTSKGRLSTSSPVAEAKAQPRTVLRGKVALGVAIVLPSKPTIPVTSSSSNKSRVEKTKLQPPKRAVGSWRRSPSSCPSSRPESSEDLFSDSASVASDISDSSLNSSLLGKRTLTLPAKSGVRNLSGGKALPLQTRRKNTSSSSSSVSSFNSSISLSPAKGKLNSSVNRSVSSSTGPAPRSVNSLSRPRRSTIYNAAESVSSITAGHRSLSTQAKKLSEAECIKDARSTPQKRAEATPSKRSASNLTDTSTSRLQSGLKAKPKPEAVVLPTPTTGGKGVRHTNDISKALKPKRLISLNGMDSLPQKPSTGPVTPSISCKSLPTKARRPSALPTPVRRKASLIPSATPKPPAVSDPVPTPNSCTKWRSCSPTLKETQVEEEKHVAAPDIQPFCLDEEEPPATTPSNTQQNDQSERMDARALILDESAPSRNLIELEPTEENDSKRQEVLLVDLPPPILSPQEKLLIDLTNTPDLIRTNNKTCNGTQLIDLSSPLIKWSPEDKTENTAPLINLSF